MQSVRLRKVGGSMMFAVPRYIAERLDLTPGREMSVDVVDGAILARPLARKTYTLSGLLAECDAAAPRSAEDEAWLNAPAVGRELI
jgi:antitoxin ChpS